ncbi:MAG: beta-propeller fold lactonase family protein, partial [Candidatus Omnitrophica bacterium]|nr:beta-propeller fold lactonase family protein [Candidatus Omnitrophota bacterium]
TRVYCFEGEPLYIWAQGKTITLNPGQRTEIMEGKAPQAPFVFEEKVKKTEPAAVQKQEVKEKEPEKKEVIRPRPVVKKKKKPLYVTKTYCYEGVVEVWGKKRRIFLFPGEFTAVIEGGDPAPAASIQGGSGGSLGDIGDPELPEESVFIRSLTPSQIGPGYSGNLTIQGAGFKSGASVSISGTGITINSVSVASGEQIIVNIDTTLTITSGLRDVTVTNIGGDSYILAGGLTISNQPTITSLVPNSLHQGRQNEDILVNGTNFRAGANVSFSGSGVSVNSVTVNSLTQLTVNISIINAATQGTRDVIVTNSDGGTGTLADGFTVTKGNYIYVANLFDDNATIIDTTDNTLVGTVSLGNSPAHGEVTPDGSYAYIPNMNTDTVSVISTATNTITDTINLSPAGAAPEFLAISPDGNYVYVSDTSANRISIISTASNTEVNTIVTGNQPVGLDVTPDGGRLYVALAADNQVRVYTISGANLNLLTTVNVGTMPYGLRIAPTTDPVEGNTYVYVANRGDDDVTVIRTSDNSAKAADVSTGILTYPRCIAVAADAGSFYVTNEWDDTVTKVTVGTWAADWSGFNVDTAVGTSPIGLGIDPDGEDYLYVANQDDDTVTVLDISGVPAFEDTINAGDGAWAVSIKDPGSSVSRKQANKREVTVGDIITYTITLDNNQTGTIFGVNLRDNVPAGFKYIQGSSYLNGQDITPTIAGRRLDYNIGDLSPGSTKVLKYQVRVSAGVTFGSYTNTASAAGVLNGNPYNFPGVICSVRVVPDPIFDLGTVIGKVFIDSNNNGIQDNKEKGLQGARIITEEGIVITTDENGKYHIPGLWPCDHLLKLDLRTVPKGYGLASRNPVVVHITEGLLSKVNFALTSQDKEAGQKENKLKLPLLKDDYFLVFLGSLDFYKLSTEGSLETVSPHDKYENKWYIDKACAFYLKGQIKGEYIITSSLNTNRQNSELVRFIDPDKYYPVYGDSSEIDFSATNTQGKFFVKVEKGKSYAMWGNYHTDFSDTQLTPFRRTLYGGKLYYESEDRTSLGKPKDKLNMFISTVKQAASHDRFKATGGTLYYLKHTEIVPGSERVYVEIQDRVTKLGLSQIEISPLDYEIDYDSGRILLSRPLSSIAFSSHLITEDTLINGEPNYLVIDYEYETLDKMHSDAYGARFSRWISDNIALGVSATKSLREGRNHDLFGADLNYIFNKDNWASFEVARSFSSNTDYNSSSDGGLTFSTTETDTHSRSKAFSFRGGFAFFQGRLRLYPYFKKLYPGFSNAALSHLSGTEIFGLETEWMINSFSRLKFIHNVNINLSGEYVNEASASTTKRVQTDEVSLTMTPDKKTAIEAAYRMVRKKNPLNLQTDDDQSQTLAVKYTRKLNKKLSAYTRAQASLEGKHNNQGGVGVIYTPSENTSLSVEESVGDKGNATLLSLNQKINKNTTVNTNLSISSEGLSSSLGTSADLDNNTRLKFNRNFSQDLSSNVISLSKNVGNNLDLDLSFERSEFNDDDENAYRNVFSGGLRWKRDEFIDYLLRLEFRQDKTTSQRLNQYLVRNYLKYTLNQDFYLYIKANLSVDSDRENYLRKENFREFSLGFAYRPVDFDKFNCLLKLTHLQDRPPSSQEDFRQISKSISNVASFEYAYDLTGRLQLVQKMAMKLQDERVGSFPHQHSKTYLALNRLNLKLTDSWQLGLEYRQLFQEETESKRQGFLFEIDKYLTENFFIGLGYNFTDFSDDLTDQDSYRSKGVFFKVKGIY